MNQLIDIAIEHQSNNLESLTTLNSSIKKHHLLENEFMQNFILQHYDQHYESMQMVLQQRALQYHQQNNYLVSNILHSSKSPVDTLIIKTNTYNVGSDINTTYDNEQPRHKIKLKNYSIATKPVSNSEYLAFMQDDGYRDKKLWSDEGWAWLQNQPAESPVFAPEHWMQDENENWFGISADGLFELEEKQAVYGINYYEAEAFAKWCNARLPHEHEWEIAATEYQLNNTGNAWEWCHNRFYPYSGFKAFPYDGYSMPWFEQPHYVLKGGSPHTQRNIKRTTFRNFFGPDKRHIFAGCRLVYD